MKRGFFRTGCALIAAAMLFAAAGCSQNSSENGGGQTVITQPFSTNTVVERPVFSESEVDLVSGGMSDFTVVYPENASDKIVTAVAELRDFFQEATGVVLPAVVDSAASATLDHIISIGMTEQLAETDIDVAAENLGASGYIIKRVGGDVYIASDGYYGSLYGVYEFLSYQFNFEVFAPECIRLETGVRDKKLLDFDLVDIPDIEYRLGGNGDLTGYSTEPRHSDRMRVMGFNVYAGGWGEDEIEPFHNFLDVVPMEKYQAAHPEWYSPMGDQVCLTRDPDGLRAAVLEGLIEMLLRYPERNAITFTAEDGGTWCSHCMAEYAALGTGGDESVTEDPVLGLIAPNDERAYYAAQYTIFMNELAKDLKEWNMTVCPERDIILYMFAYGATNAAPVLSDENGDPILDADGNYQIFDSTLEISDNLGVFFCYTWSNTYTGQYDEESLYWMDQIERWKTITDNFSIWTYYTNFQNYLVPYDSMQQFQDNVRYAVNNAHAQIYYMQSQHNMRTGVDWSALESYLQSKLSWNSNANVPRLIDEFFENYYGEAAETMKSFYYDYKAYMSYLATELSIGEYRDRIPETLTTTAWPYNILTGFLEDVDAAYASIAPIQYSDPERYSRLYDRINVESLPYRYMLYYMYPSKFGFEELEELKERFKSEAIALGVTNYRESSGIESAF